MILLFVVHIYNMCILSFHKGSKPIAFGRSSGPTETKLISLDNKKMLPVRVSSPVTHSRKLLRNWRELYSLLIGLVTHSNV